MTSSATDNAFQFVVGFDHMEQGRRGIARAARRQLSIALSFASADALTATRPDCRSSADDLTPYTLAVDDHLKWLIETVMEEMVGHTPAPFAVSLSYPRPGEAEGRAAVAQLDHPDTPAYSLSGTVITDALKTAILAASKSGLELVPMLSGLHQRFVAGDYGDASPETIAANKEHLAAGAGEVTGIYLTATLPEPSIAVSQYLPYEKGAILMLGREYHAMKYQPAADQPSRP